jgi:broad specificity phosphatase PhoE
MTMRTLILIKHSLPQIEPDVPAHRWQLSDEGRARCKPLADALAPYAPSVIFCSREPKARETARVVADQLAIECHSADSLHEHDRSNVPLLPQLEFERLVRRLFQNPNQLVFGRETAQQALQRFSQAVDHVLQTSQGTCAAIVSHGTVISLLAGERTGCEPFDLWRQLELPSFLVLAGPPWQVHRTVFRIASD